MQPTPRQRTRRTIAAACLALAALLGGCVSIPVSSPPTASCEDAPAPGSLYPDEDWCAREYLVVGLFPAIGEAHLNDLSSKGMPLTTKRRVADYTFLSGWIAFSNITGFGLSSIYSLMYEPGEDYHQSRGACTMALLGFCKAAKAIARSTIPFEDAVPEGTVEVPETLDPATAARRERAKPEPERRPEDDERPCPDYRCF